MEEACKLLRTMAKGLLCWYEFKAESSILYIGDEADPIVEFFGGRQYKITVAGSHEYRGAQFMEEKAHSFDYIIAVSELEKGFEPQEKLKCMKKLLARDGVLLIGANNRLGIRYFCGDRDNYSGNCLDGIDNYIMLSKEEWGKLEGRNYSKAELTKFIDSAGFANNKFYSVFPNLEIPQHIFADGYTPNEELNVRLFPAYDDKENIWLDEKYLYTDLIENGLFHTLANSFLIECSDAARLSDVDNVTCALDRNMDDAQLTIIKGKRTVEKMAFYDEGRAKYEKMLKNTAEMEQNGVKTLNARIIAGRYVMDFVDSENAEVYLRRLALAGRIDEFISEVDRFRETILHSSEWTDENENGVVLKKAYVDMLPLNCFVINGEYVFYDQEFYEYDYPANAIIFRVVDTLYNFDAKLEQVVPRQFFMERYGLWENRELWQKMSDEWGVALKCEEPLLEYYNMHRAFPIDIVPNRAVMKFYEHKDYGISPRALRGLGRYLYGKKLIIFGTGSYAKKYFERYSEINPPIACIDNNHDKQGTEFCATPVYGAEYLKGCTSDDYRVIICVKDYEDIVAQVEALGIEEKNIRVITPNFLTGA